MGAPAAFNIVTDSLEFVHARLLSGDCLFQNKVEHALCVGKRLAKYCLLY